MKPIFKVMKKNSHFVVANDEGAIFSWFTTENGAISAAIIMHTANAENDKRHYTKAARLIASVAKIDSFDHFEEI